MPRPLFVTTTCFRRTMRTLIANFDQHLPDERVDDVEALYRRVFTDSGPLGDAPQDALLEQAVDWIVDHREERGMPRVAELRQALDPLVETERLQREGQETLDHYRRLEEQAAERRRGR